MSIIRVAKNKNNPYTIIRADTLKDRGLSWRATGLLAYLLSMPDDWEVHIAELAHHKTDGARSLRAGIKELMEAGYIVRETIREGNRIKEWRYTVYESSALTDIPFEPVATTAIESKTLLCYSVQVQGEQVQKSPLLSIDDTKYPSNQVSNNDNASVAALGSVLSQGIIKEYFKVYRECAGEEHPRLKKAQVKNVCAALDTFITEMGADDLGAWEEMINGHFTRTDKLKTDYNINHFATDGIMRNLFYKRCY